jgi:hypothetical protein
MSNLMDILNAIILIYTKRIRPKPPSSVLKAQMPQSRLEIRRDLDLDYVTKIVAIHPS